MNSITLEMLGVFSGDGADLEGVDELDDFIFHYGVGPDDNPPGRGSGRYPKGSGEDPFQHAGDFATRVQRLKKKNPNLSEHDIALLSGCSNTEEFKALYSGSMELRTSKLPSSSSKEYKDAVKFITDVQTFRKEHKGMADKDIAPNFDFKNSNDFRTKYSQALHLYKAVMMNEAKQMLADGKTQDEVASHFGISSSTLRSRLNTDRQVRASAAQVAADGLRELVEQHRMVDVGSMSNVEIGTKVGLNISKTKFEEALSILQDEGYSVFGGRVEQATNKGMKTTIRVLCAPEVQPSDVYQHPERIKSIADYEVKTNADGDEIFSKKWEYPASMDGKRLLIRYADDITPDGHKAVERDGTIEIRRNVPDLSLENSNYAQVRILVDNKQYLKGMALYSDEIPDGYDVVFNTNKKPGDKVLKDIKSDPDNPFGALLRYENGQYHYIDEKTGESKLGLINKTRQEGDWEEWSKNTPSQFLSKQPPELINRQLNLAIDEKRKELNEIMSLTNPTVKRKLLEEFATTCDGDALHLRAAPFEGQKYQVLLPVPTLKDDEVYAPNFKEGETIACIRFPHEGIYQIVIAKVTHKNPQGTALLGKDPIDAIGLNKANAEKLSGADNDGDTLLCIPCNDPKYSDIYISSRPLLEGLVGYDAKESYGYDAVTTTTKRVKNKKTGEYEEVEVKHYFRDGKEFKPMKKANEGMQMGIASNLITDMTAAGAPDEDLAAATRYSMCVIDSEKHKLDWQQCAKDNHIEELKAKYQRRWDEEKQQWVTGAATIMSRAKSPLYITRPTGNPHIDPETGKLTYTEKQLNPEGFVGRDGEVHQRQMKVSTMSVTDDAFSLVRDPNNVKEVAYAHYANSLKAMANEARKESLRVGSIEFNKSAKEQYAKEVEYLTTELQMAELNAPRERMAQLYASGIKASLKREFPDMTKKELDKAAQRALANGRIRFNAHRHPIDITPACWAAIQAGAIRTTTLLRILEFADMDQIRNYATPKKTVQLTEGQKTRLITYINRNLSSSEIATALGISESFVNQEKKRLREQKRE